MHRTVFGSFSDIIGLGYNRFKPTTASLTVFQITVIFRSLTRDHQDSKQRNAKHALNYGISFADAK